jgi:glycosyltransferase involved in cell wall biosynthesis
VIITLSTIPPRFNYLRPTLNSLLHQKHSAEQIILYIPERYRRFPEWDGKLPDVPRGITIRRTPLDFGPATKVLPAIREFSGRDVDILFCDDDVIYDPKWSWRFAKLREKMPDVCLAEAGKEIADAIFRAPDRLPRVHRGPRALRHRLLSLLKHRRRLTSHYLESGYCDIFLGVSGVMVRPSFFTGAAFDIPEILWTVDDVWLSGNLEAKGIPIWLNADAPRRRERRNRRISSLKDLVHQGHGRRAANQACVEYFRKTMGIWAIAADKDVEPVTRTEGECDKCAKA